MKKRTRVFLFTVFILIAVIFGSFIGARSYEVRKIWSGLVVDSSNTSIGKNENQILSNVDDLKDLIDKYFLFDYSEEDLENGIYKGMLEALDDPYSVYYTSEEYKKLMEDTAGEFAGIGVYIDSSQDYITVVSPIEGTPADKAGLQTGDLIIKVDGVEYMAEEVDAAVRAMKGEPGTDVTLTIRRINDDESTKEFDVTITRDNIKVDTISSSMVDDKIGYINISQFDEPTASDFKKSYGQLKEAGMEKLIIDLRNNPGGLLDVVTEIADMFMDKGVIVYQVDKNGDETTINSDASRENIPIVILINEGSASASEILAGALQDVGSAKVVGKTSFGKGIVQRIFPLKATSETPGVKITISEYFTPSRNKIHGVGIIPDYEVDMALDEPYGIDNLDTDVQLKKAIDVIGEQ